MIKYTREILQEAVDNATSVAGALRYLGLKEAGGTHSYISRLIKNFGIDTKHFTGRAHQKGKAAYNKKTAKDILINSGNKRQKSEQLRRALLESGVDYKCSLCNISEWENKKLGLHVDHIDGNFSNNVLGNLRFLCPNCHSQTPNYSRKKS
jgi:hypothetical protein